ncbi:MAG: hypothetical protein R3E66_24020 [bacterium]
MIGALGNNITQVTIIDRIRIQTPNATGTGVSNYGLHCTNCAGLLLRNSEITAVGLARTAKPGPTACSGRAAEATDSSVELSTTAHAPTTAADRLAVTVALRLVGRLGGKGGAGGNSGGTTGGCGGDQRCDGSGSGQQAGAGGGAAARAARRVTAAATATEGMTA